VVVIAAGLVLLVGHLALIGQGIARRTPSAHDVGVFGATLGETKLPRSGLGFDRSDGPWVSSRGHRCSLSERSYLPFLSFLFFFLANPVS
jgi:hypothetical protein